MRPIRVLHCPTTVGGNPQGLARAERELGLRSRAVAFRQDIFSYPIDEVLVDRNDSTVKLEAKRWGLLRRAMREYDVVHYNFGHTIFPVCTQSKRSGFPLRCVSRAYRRLVEMCDLTLLHWAGKGIVVTYQGDDARQGDYCLRHFEISIAREVHESYYTLESDAGKRSAIMRFSQIADRIFYLNPDLGWVLPERARFMPYGHIDLREWTVPPRQSSSDRLTILHAPSHRGAKGTQHIIQAVNRLHQEGVEFEFLLVEGLPHHEARSLYERADLLVDQLLAGWYGGLAVELMALGKPVICYIREGDLQFIPETMRHDLPIISATPATLYDVLRKWVTVRRTDLPELGLRSRAYVEKWHDPLRIATVLKAEYEAIVASKRHRDSF